MESSQSPLTVIADVANELGETPLWDHRHDTLWWSDIKRSQLFRLHRADAGLSRWNLPRPASAIACIAGGDHLIMACPGALMRFDPDSGTAAVIAPFEDDIPTNRPNDGKCDPEGRFWVGSMDDAEQCASGALYRIGADLAIEAVVGGLEIPNTLAWSPDRRTFYCADSPTRTIWAYDYTPADGAIANKRPFVTVDIDGAVPDGSAIDEDGYLWNAQWGGWRVVRYAPDGAIDRIVDMPVACPTSCAFGGPDMTTLFITSARKGQSPAALAKQPHAGAVFALKTDVRGTRQTPFRIAAGA
ncbi:SMP-30/gluconolactonase/LRE family protein [Varunaivibrio sulfuroxidans]|uniref:L-arabinonolactonase n=1 Tax=Varunaivibrio sulfuroxidans TaxID=1773489 RepID=A0A4V2UN91_9PROT|nr:SMP-30/gluconolactonase/LRE family protein [Varunaivibrio sulfuroxidans]TCS60941.1 L-arabinonolactonase [Varunaivibrio sulfuroxidans]WES31651.1 SMP-30/gluconolactonase/LRE family protein [Varunaivibrio sulfuroxidans]